MTPILTATGNRTFSPPCTTLWTTSLTRFSVHWPWISWCPTLGLGDTFEVWRLRLIKNSGNMNNLIILRNLTAHNGYSTCRPCMLNNIWLCGLYEYSTAHELFITSRSTPLDEISRGCNRKRLQTRSLGQPNVGWRHPTALARWACCRCLGCYAKVAKAKTVPETFSYVRGLLYFLFRNLM